VLWLLGRMNRSMASLVLLVSVITLARAERDATSLSLSENARKLLQERMVDNYGEDVGDTSYGAESPDSEAYQQAASQAMPNVVTELRLACSCSLKIPCFDIKTSACVPTVCGSNSKASFVDNRVPRYSHPTYDDDADNSTAYEGDGYRNLASDYSASAEYGSGGLDGPGYSNPIIAGCRCPSGTTRCYQCAEIGFGTRIFMWILFVSFIMLAVCCVRLIQTDPLPPTLKNQEAQAICGAMYFIFALAALQYLCHALDWGYTVRWWDLRHIYYVRYFDWLVCTLLMMYVIGWLAEASKTKRAFLMLLDAIMITFGYIASVIHSNVKWLFFFVGFIAYVSIAVILHSQLQPPAGADVKKTSVALVLKWVVTVFYVLYPIVWILAEGIGHLCASTEATLYGLIDFGIKLSFCGIVALARPLLTTGANLPQGAGNPNHFNTEKPSGF